MRLYIGGVIGVLIWWKARINNIRFDSFSGVQGRGHRNVYVLLLLSGR